VTRRASRAASKKVDTAIGLAEAAHILGKEAEGVKEDALREFGRGLHPFQDSFSHEGGDFSHPFRGKPGDRDFSSPMEHYTDQTYTDPVKSEQMARAVLEKMLEFRRARGDTDVPSLDVAWGRAKNEVREFIVADTRSEKEEILRRWGVDPGDDKKWDMSLRDREEIRLERDGVWGKVRSFYDEQRRRLSAVVEASKTRRKRELDEEIRARREAEEREVKQKKDLEERRKALVIPEVPDGN